MAGDITLNLSRHEFACRCGCGLADPHPLVVVRGQEIRDRTGATAIIVHSGSRCETHNREAGGSPHSQHLVQPERAGYTCAADYEFRGVPLTLVVEAALEIPEFAGGGIGIYLEKPGGVTRVHLDVRGWMARWGYIDGKPVAYNVALAEMYRRFRP